MMYKTQAVRKLSLFYSSFKPSLLPEQDKPLISDRITKSSFLPQLAVSHKTANKIQAPEYD